MRMILKNAGFIFFLLISFLLLMLMWRELVRKQEELFLSPEKEVIILGAGASFPAPLMQRWAREYETLTRGRVRIDYQVTGSGEGIDRFLEKSVMFGAADTFLSEEPGSRIFHVPFALGDVVISYNLPDVEEEIVFSSELISAIFFGDIKNWNDPVFSSLNPEVSFPDLPVLVVHRSDASGTTAIFTDYLCKVSEKWRQKIGSGLHVEWPAGIGASGNSGVAEKVMSRPGAVGYSSFVYAISHNLGYGSIINRSGKVISPALDATRLSAKAVIPQDGRISLTDTEVSGGYPITGFSWALVYEELSVSGAVPDRKTAEELIRFLYWIITEGQRYNEELNFARLPRIAQDVAISMLNNLEWKGIRLGERVISDIRTRGF
jgi:phosphate transport system substrate-binding protein